MKCKWTKPEYKNKCFKCIIFVISNSSQPLVQIRILPKILINKSSVIRQKRESQNECFKKIKYVKFPKNEHFLPPDTHMYVCVSGG